MEMDKNIPDTMLAFDYGKTAEEIKVGIIVVHNRKLLLIPYQVVRCKPYGVTLTGETLLSLCGDIGKPCNNDGTIIGFTTLSE